MRRLLSAILSAMLLAGLLPLQVLAAAPVADAQLVTTNEDTPVSITLTGSDADSDPMTFSVVEQPLHGTLTGTAPDLTYTPAANYDGADSFTFTASDGTVNSDPATVSIDVTAVNDKPVCTGPYASSGAEEATQGGSLSCADIDSASLTYAKTGDPNFGSATVDMNGDWTYTPAANYDGADSFTFTASDGTLDSDTATVSIDVTAVNDSPVANAQSVTTNEDTAKAITLVGTDVDLDTLTYTVVTGPAHGTLSSGTGAARTYTPAANYSGPDSFTFRVNDGLLNSTTATVSITVSAVNDAPVANAQSVTTNEDTAKAITLTGSDVEGSALTYTIVTGPTHGTLTGTAPDLTYTPAANYDGADSFTFTASDGTLDSDTATVSIDVTAVNDSPVANAQSVTTNEDTAKAITLVGTDVDLDTLTYTVVTGPAHGTLSSGTGAARTYTPAANYSGPDSFTFRVNDGLLNSTTATVSITVSAVNDAPVANAQSVTTNEDTAKAITLTGSDVEGSALTYTIVTGPTHGTLTGTAPDLTYTPAANYDGADSFTFTASDGTLDSDTATVSIDVTAVNDSPVANAQSVTTNEDTAKAITLVGTDVDLDTLTYTVVTGPAHGTLSSGTGAARTYTPAANYSGPDSFTFRVNDGLLNSTTATVSITVSAVNDAPVANAQSVTTNEDTAKAITLTGSDVEGSALTYTIVTGPTHGTLTGTAPDLTYTPAANYDGADSFTFTASDGTLDSDTATVSIDVTAVNDSPVCTPLALGTDKNVAVNGTVVCTDVDSPGLTLRIGTGPGKGRVTQFNTATGAFTYTPNTGASGSDSFTVIASDGVADSLAVTVVITIGNHAPVANAQSVTTNEDTAKAITLVGTDVDLDTLTYTVVTGPAHGTLSSGTGAARTYTPAANYSGPDSFTFRVNDGLLNSTTATVSITVSAVNDAPVANAQSVTTNEDAAAKAITLAGSDVEGSALTFTVLTSPGHGTLSGTGAARTYKPAANYSGADSFTFRVNDGLLNSATATVSITVTAVNDAPVARTDGFTVNATTTSTITVLANDYSGPAVSGVTSEPTDTITVKSVGTAARGTLSIAAGGTAVTYDPTGCGTGGDSFTYTIADSRGLTATATAFVTIARPGTNGLSVNPITDTPATGLVSNSTIGSTVPLRVSWCGATASPTTVRGYTAQQSSTGGSTWPTAAILTATKATSSTRNLSVGATYQWRTRTIDSVGRTGAYRTSLTARIARYQENSTAITYAGTWGTSKSSSYSGGAERWTRTAGATATITLTNARQFAIVGPRSSTRGSFRIYVDDVLVATVSERATKPITRRVLYVRSLTAGANVKHKIQVRAVGNGRIDLDAILSLTGS